MSPPRNLTQDCKESLLHELQKFMSSDLMAYTFPSTLTSEERKFLHLKSAELGLKTKSHGRPGENRSITIYMDKKKVNSKACSIEVSSVSNELMKKICDTVPITKQMYDELLPNPIKPYRRMAAQSSVADL